VKLAGHPIQAQQRGHGSGGCNGESGNNPNANTTGPNSLTEPAMFISQKVDFYSTNPRRIIPSSSVLPIDVADVTPRSKIMKETALGRRPTLSVLKELFVAVAILVEIH